MRSTHPQSSMNAMDLSQLEESIHSMSSKESIHSKESSMGSIHSKDSMSSQMSSQMSLIHSVSSKDSIHSKDSMSPIHSKDSSTGSIHSPDSFRSIRLAGSKDSVSSRRSFDFRTTHPVYRHRTFQRSYRGIQAASAPPSPIRVSVRRAAAPTRHSPNEGARKALRCVAAWPRSSLCSTRGPSWVSQDRPGGKCPCCTANQQTNKPQTELSEPFRRVSNSLFFSESSLFLSVKQPHEKQLLVTERIDLIFKLVNVGYHLLVPGSGSLLISSSVLQLYLHLFFVLL